MKTDGVLLFFNAMNAIASPIRKKKFSQESLEAADRLLKAAKEKLLRENGSIDYDALRQKGYSDTMIGRLKKL